MEPIGALIFVLFGLLVGVTATRFGIGGSIISIPFFRIVFGMSGQAAIATALPITVPTALSGAVVFYRKKLIKIKTTITAGVVGSFFSILGAYFTEYFTSDQLMIIMSLLFFVLAYIVHKAPWRDKKVEVMPLHEKAMYTILIGIVAGFLSGFLGIGGGVILVPMLAAIRHIPLKKAIPTSLAIIAIYAIPGSFAHYMLGNMDTGIVTFVLLGSIVGAHIGAYKTMKERESELGNAFATLLVILGSTLLAYELVQLALAG